MKINKEKVSSLSLKSKVIIMLATKAREIMENGIETRHQAYLNRHEKYAKKLTNNRIFVIIYIVRDWWYKYVSKQNYVDSTRYFGT